MKVALAIKTAQIHGRHGAGEFLRQSGSFQCKHCRQYVLTAPAISGVQNRNHCPFCLWSRHLDLYRAGDRLSACKGEMQPVGLTAKPARNKYAGAGPGELMLVHRCVECGKLSANRLAADDHSLEVLHIYEQSLSLDRDDIQSGDLRLLAGEHRALVHTRLFGVCTTLAV